MCCFCSSGMFLSQDNKTMGVAFYSALTGPNITPLRNRLFYIQSFRVAGAGKQHGWNGYLLMYNMSSDEMHLENFQSRSSCHLIFHLSVHEGDMWRSGSLWCPFQCWKKNFFSSLETELSHIAYNMILSFPKLGTEQHNLNWNVSESLQLFFPHICLDVYLCVLICLHLCSWMKPVRQKAAPSTSSQMWRRWWWWSRWRSTWSQRRAGQMVRPLLLLHFLPPVIMSNDMMTSFGCAHRNCYLLLHDYILDKSPGKTVRRKVKGGAEGES